MIEETISAEEARRFYDRLGAGHDWAEFYESRAKQQALSRLELNAGQQVLNVGVGTGRAHAKIQEAVGPDGLALGLDLSRVMLRLTRQRTTAPVCAADGRHLPFSSASFDHLFSSYVLDLIPAGDLPRLLAEFHRVLKAGGRLALVSLTEGSTPISRTLMGLWKTIYRLSPYLCGGCRPVQLSDQVRSTGFRQVRREVVVQLGVPSEIITATV